MITLHNKLSLFLATPLLASLLTTATIGARAETDAPPRAAVTVQSAAPGQQSRATRLWTREARQQARPTSWNDAVLADVSQEAADVLSRGGVGQLSLGGAPGPEADQDAQRLFPREWQGISEQPPADQAEATDDPGVFGTAGVYTPYPVNYHAPMWLYYPWKAIGKLYFTTPSGSSGYCTASVVSPNNIIATAAHCLYTRGAGWNSNFLFVPAERYGSAPYGTYSWSSATILTDYITTGARRTDVGLIQLTNNSAGQPVTYYTGYLGRAWDWGYTQSLHSIGYASNLSTVYTNLCAAESFYSSLEGTDVLVKGCNMTYGSSGGPWVVAYRPYESGAMNYVDGVVSGPHVASGTFGNTYVGPRFSSANIVPLCSTMGC